MSNLSDWEQGYDQAKQQFYDERKAYEQRIASLEAQLADARARLAGYEVGYDPNVQLPEFVDRYGWVLAIQFKGQNPSMYHYSSFDQSWQNLKYDIFTTAQIVRWFPLPGAKEEE